MLGQDQNQVCLNPVGPPVHAISNPKGFIQKEPVLKYIFYRCNEKPIILVGHWEQNIIYRLIKWYIS